jgi:hypothetical protein
VNSLPAIPDVRKTSRRRHSSATGCMAITS